MARWGATLIVVMLSGLAALPATAQTTCAPRKITATGKSATMTFFARARAKTAWVQKVAADSRLGPTYGQWLRARERRVVCRTVERQYICLAAALPCRSGVQSVSGAVNEARAVAERKVARPGRERPL